LAATLRTKHCETFKSLSILNPKEEKIQEDKKKKEGSWNSSSSSPPVRTITAISPPTACPNKYMFTLKMATAIFIETSDNFKHSTLLIP
jgi:hypothetical protein